MTAIAQDYWQEQADEPRVRIDGRVDPQREEAHWQRTFWAEPYYRAGLDYEAYAPAFCVGYIGCAQYGGEFAEAEKSLCANWLRIKGDSPLSLEEAMQAIRAAWEHAARAQAVEEEEEEFIRLEPLPAAGDARRPAYVAA